MKVKNVTKKRLAAIPGTIISLTPATYKKLLQAFKYSRGVRMENSVKLVTGSGICCKVVQFINIETTYCW